ncbi:MAG TPA: hypothetical protein VM658_01070 [bacterium]|nr:hypothetical protein [bacterium]
MRIFILVMAGAALAALSAPWGAARADLNDYAFLPPVLAGDSVTDLAVTPDNRYVLLLDRAAKSLRFVDTWNFALLAGSTAAVKVDAGTGTVPLCLALSPDGQTAYVGLASGQAAAVDLTGLASLLPFHRLTAALTVKYSDVAAGSALDHIATVPNVGADSGYTYVFFGASAQNRLYYARFKGTAITGTATTWAEGGTPLVHTPLGLAGGYKTMFEVYSTAGGVYLKAITCNDAQGANGVCGTAGTTPVLAAPGQAFFGLAADPKAGAFAVTADWTEGSLWGINTTLPGALLFGSSVAIASQPVDLAVLGAGLNQNAAVFAAGDSPAAGTLAVAELTGSTPEFVNPPLVLDAGVLAGLTLSVTSVAASSSLDRYAYVGGNYAGAAYVAPFTANPLIDGLTVIEGFTVDLGFTVTDGYTVSFTVFAAPGGSNVSYDIYKDTTFGAWSAKVASAASVAEGTTVEVRISAALLAECENVLTVIAQDSSSRKGRMAILANKDTTPPAQSFSLDFGDHKLLVSFTASGLCDLAAYEIYYTTDPAVLDYDTLSAHYTPITISPAAGDAIQETIKGLTNGIKYFVYVAAIDTGGKASLSRKSAMPQPTLTLTQLTGEKGGANCLPSLGGKRRGDPWSMAWFLAPLLAVGSFKLLRRWKR